MENQTAAPSSENTLEKPMKLVSDKPRSKLPIFIALGIITLIVGTLAVFILTQGDKKETDKKQEASSSATKETDKKNANIGYVTALEGLNLREEPSVDSRKILLLPEGSEVEILGSEGDWYFIETTTKGFVAKEFISDQKPTKTLLKTFKNDASPFNFLYPDVYEVTFKNPDEKTLEYSFQSSDSYGGFKIETETGFATLGNYALKNYPTAKMSACQVQFANERKECEQLETGSGTLYLLLIETTLYKITYLKTEGGALADINNLVFYTMFFKE